MISVTDLALADLEMERVEKEFPKDDLARFMSAHCLFFDYESERWWRQVTDPRSRMSIAIELIDLGYEDIASYVVKRLRDDAELPALNDPLPAKTKTALLKTAIGAPDAETRGGILETLERLTPRANRWIVKSENPLYDDGLAILALDDSEQGDQAARLLGRAHSEEGTLAVYREAQKERVLPALMTIQETAGSLPRSLPLPFRLKISSALAQERVLSQPWTLVAAYGLSFLGTALGVGIQVFLRYRLPKNMDPTRFTISVEHGVALGAMIGLIILAIRLTVEWFRSVHPLSRSLLGTFVGGLALTVAFFVYDVLLLHTAPIGFLLIASCLALALGYTLAALFPSRVWKSIVALVALFSTQLGSLIASLSLNMTPLFLYDLTDPSWTWPRIVMVIAIVSLPMAILPNLHRLNLREGN
jgi:hypothetical protein